MSLLGPDFSYSPVTVLYRKHNLLATASRKALFLELTIFLALMVLYIILQTITGVILAYLTYGNVSRLSLLSGVIMGMFPTAILIVFALWAMIARFGKNPAEFLNLRKPGLSWLGWGLVIGCFCLMIFAIMAVIGQVIDSQQDEVKDVMFNLASSPQLYTLATASAVIGAPLAEEFLFRGYLFAVLAPTRLGFTGTILITSGLWALMHAGTASLLLLGVIFVMGCVLGYILVRFGSLWLTLVCHAVWNFISAMLIFAAGGAGS